MEGMFVKLYEITEPRKLTLICISLCFYLQPYDFFQVDDASSNELLRHPSCKEECPSYCNNQWQNFHYAWRNHFTVNVSCGMMIKFDYLILRYCTSL